MRSADWLQQATVQLAQAGIATAHLDCLVLLEDCLQQDRSWLLAHPEHLLTDQQLAGLQPQLAARAQHQPLAYLRGHTEFYGRSFGVTPAVLEPRPETETMIDLLKQLCQTHPQLSQAYDIGTGSGAIAITARLECPQLAVFGTDIDRQCLVVARQNARKHQTKIPFWRGNLIAPLRQQITTSAVILANLPYVPDSHRLNQAAMNEPKQAIFGGPDGLDLYRHLFDQLQPLPQPPQYILTEALPFQHHLLAEIARSHHYILEKTSDFIQLFSWSN